MSAEVVRPDSDQAAAPGAKADFYSFTLEELEDYLGAHFALPAFRARQLFQWIYHKGVRDTGLMTDLARPVREIISSAFSFSQLEIRDRRLSSDGTRKYLFEVDGGDLVEAVMIKQPARMTLCVSSQVGCCMGCTFCRTGTMGLKRNLSASEIVRQIATVIEDAGNFGDMFQNIVFMGMGEPLHNYDNLVKALTIIKSDFGLAVSGRRITISSAGLVPAIRKFGGSGLDVNLAISLNATSDEVRSRIMPVNKAWPLESLLECLRSYPLKPRKRITIEYVLLAGVNDSAEDLKRLPKLLRKIPVKINLIPYNETSGLGFSSPSRDTVTRWQDSLLKSGIETTIRWSKGLDIDAACGQLASSSAALNA